MRQEELDEYYKKQIKGHEKTKEYALQNHGYIKLMHYIRSKLPEKGLILDAGCNQGYECIAIQNEHRKVIGIDIGEDFVKEAKSIGIDARVMDMHKMGFMGDMFDAIYCNNTLEHAYDHMKVLSEMMRVLKKGGIAIICIPSDHLNPEYVPTENWDDSLHIWQPTFDEFKETVKEAGFKIVEAEELNGKEKFGLENKASENHYMVIVCLK